MNNERSLLQKTIIKFGLIVAVMSLVSFVFSYLKNEHLNLPLYKKTFGFIAIVVPIVYGIRAFKKENGGFLRFKEALKTGIGITVLASILITLSYYIFLTVIEPDTMRQIAKLYQTRGLDIYYIKPWLLSLAIGILVMFTGTVITLISGLLFKKSIPEMV